MATCLLKSVTFVTHRSVDDVMSADDVELVSSALAVAIRTLLMACVTSESHQWQLMGTEHFRDIESVQR